MADKKIANELRRSCIMPDLSHSFYGFRHTVDSALEVLAVLDIPEARVNVRVVGGEMSSRWVEDQFPPPGAILLEDTLVTLSVAGLGFCHHLPVAMQDSGGEQEPGTKEVFELLDDPLRKAHHWVCEGSTLFNIAPDQPEACARWVAVFGLEPDLWPAQQLYSLALLLPSLQALAGTERGIRLSLELLLHLPVQKIRRHPDFRFMKPDQLSRLGSDFNRVSIDYVLGHCLEDLSCSELVLGPVSLDRYYQFHEPEGKELLRQVLRLVVPFHMRYSTFWVVADPNKSPRLGIREENSVLGINSYLSPQRIGVSD
jgi:hypothetical protein